MLWDIDIWGVSNKLGNFKVWLSKDILNGDIEPREGYSVDIDEWKRPYEIWEIARKFIETNDDRESLSQGIITLKRCYETRQKLIFKNYPFEKIYFDKKVCKKKKIELLAQYGLVRPYFIHKLVNVRNLIEHEDHLPPKKETCQELLDSVWYFLKSTDDLILSIPKVVAFNGEHGYVFVSFNFEEYIKSDSKINFEFKAYVNKELISFVSKDDSICLNNLEIISKVEELEKELWPYEKKHLNFRNSHIFIKGILFDDNIQFHILKKILNFPWR